MVLYQSNILVTILIGALQVGQGALSLFKVWPHSKQQLACPQSRRTHFLLLSSKQMTHLGISSSSLPSSSKIGWLMSVDSTSVAGSLTTKGFATARTLTQFFFCLLFANNIELSQRQAASKNPTEYNWVSVQTCTTAKVYALQGWSRG